jgi:hypothetical protein
MKNDRESRREAGIAEITASYLRYVDEHKSDRGFLIQGIGSIQQIRQATMNAHLVVKTNTGLDLTLQGRNALKGVGSTA